MAMGGEDVPGLGDAAVHGAGFLFVRRGGSFVTFNSVSFPGVKDQLVAIAKSLVAKL